MGICGLGGLWRTTLASEVCNHDQASFGSNFGSNFGANFGPSVGNLTQYDVFLNHRGPDLKKTFVSHLHKALRQAGCDPFLDAKSLVKGQHGLNSINEVLTGVLVHVAIFSPRYAESKYCLNELCDILESQKPIIPVFYDVEPENLRWTEVGPFAKAFHKHLKKGRNQDVVRWKAALLQVAAITGFTLAESDNDIVKLEEKVVVAVLNALPPPLPLAHIRHPVGLKEPSTHVSEMLREMGDNVGIIGICGTGGIGKTTLAREVYNHEQSNFDSRCFLKDVKETKGVDFMNLQMKMVTDLLHVDAKKLHWDFVRWFDQIQKRKVLIVIDDVSERKQVDELIPVFKDLAPGSRILITSRAKDVLKSMMVDMPKSEIYLMSELSLSDSLDLFIRCAFQKNNIDDVDETFHDIAREIAKTCSGLPLALEVMGSHLADKKNLPHDAKDWKDAIHALKSNGDIMTSLQISYDGLLNNEDKQLFLDIACFMLGQPKKVAMEIWESNGSHRPPSWSLSKLIDKCLVNVDGDGRLEMHDLLRDMGRNIVMQKARYKPEMQSHIWDASVAIKILQKEQDLNEVIALSIVGACTSIVCKAEQYSKMRELRYLLLDGCHVNGNFSEWSKELRWLQWRSLPHQELPSLIVPNLAVLDLGESNHLTHIWNRDFKLEFFCVELRMLILNNCTKLEELPENINKLSKLKCVNMEGCSNLHSLPDSIGTIKELEYLNLSRCNRLTSLPNTIINLLKLKEIIIDHCFLLKKLPMKFGKLASLTLCKASMLHALKELPDDFGELESLTKVDFEGCENLQNLCENFGSLGNLQELNLSGCKRLANLPRSFSKLSNLEKLNLSRCEQLVKLPPSIRGLKNLKVLSMRESALEELPKDFGDLKSLINANFWDCKKLQSLCKIFGSLGSLRKLNLSGCKRLYNLPKSFSELSNLEYLNLNRCEQLLKLPPINGLKKPRILDIQESRLEELPKEFGDLESLTHAYFEDCKELQSLGENFGNLGSLRELKLSGCKRLINLPKSFSNLSNLEKLNLSQCEQLLKLPPMNGLKKLRVLTMQQSTLEELSEDFDDLQSLTHVYFEDCKELQSLGENFGNLGSLQELKLSGCKRLINLPKSFSKLSSLEKLNLSQCEQLLKLPPMNGLKKLRVLTMQQSTLEELSKDFGDLESLTHAYFEDCKELQSLCENFSNLGSLEELKLSGCKRLVNLPKSFSKLSSLEELNLNQCEQLLKLPPMNGLKKLKILSMQESILEELPEDFGDLECLTHAYFKDCKVLQTLCENFGNLGNLRELKLNGCKRLANLPKTFSKLSNLEKLNLSRCEQLVKLPPSIHGLKNLKVLNMRESILEELPKDFGDLKSLIHASFGGCKKLQSLCENFGNLRSLRTLNLSGCKRLYNLPKSFSELSSLEKLNLNRCEEHLKLPPSMNGLKKLRILSMHKSTLEELPEDFGDLESLTHAYFEDCKELQSLGENFGNLGSLRELKLNGCKKLTNLPKSFSKLSNLEKLSLDGCDVELLKLLPSICSLKT